jgi:hypothetical protein
MLLKESTKYFNRFFTQPANNKLPHRTATVIDFVARRTRYEKAIISMIFAGGVAADHNRCASSFQVFASETNEGRRRYSPGR